MIGTGSGMAREVGWHGMEWDGESCVQLTCGVVMCAASGLDALEADADDFALKAVQPLGLLARAAFVKQGT